MLLTLILVGTLTAGLGSVWIAALLAHALLSRFTQHLLSLAAGALLATAFMRLLPEAFEQAGALDKLEGFASHFGPDWYGLPRNTDTITLVKESWTVPADYPYLSTDPIVPLRAGETLTWKMR